MGIRKSENKLISTLKNRGWTVMRKIGNIFTIKNNDNLVFYIKIHRYNDGREADYSIVNGDIE